MGVLFQHHLIRPPRRLAELRVDLRMPLVNPGEKLIEARQERCHFAAYLNCAASVDLNCPTAWKEEDGFLLPSSGFRM